MQHAKKQGRVDLIQTMNKKPEECPLGATNQAELFALMDAPTKNHIGKSSTKNTSDEIHVMNAKIFLIGITRCEHGVMISRF